MSHSPQRKEKICLNCNADLHGHYCHVCGQENIEPRESFLGLVTHFVYDITHFDGKFFSTLKYLVFKPGFLSKEYVRGRRVSYLHPIRMYVFTSAIFFIIFFSMFHFEKSLENATGRLMKESSLNDLAKAKEMTLKNARTKADSAEITRVMDMLRSVPVTISVDSAEKSKRNRPYINFQTTTYKSKAEYDSAQAVLPRNERDGWFKAMKVNKQLEINQKLSSDPKGAFSSWLGKFIHMFPQLLFVSLPIFALLLKLLYIRRKQFYYSDHAIFSIHVYIFTFIAMLFYFMFLKLKEVLGWDWLNFIMIGIGIYITIYTYLAMRKFYTQGRFKTFVKYCLLSLLSLIVILILFVVFFLFSVFQL